MHSDLFRKQYDFEIEQRNALASAINVPIVAITILASAASVMLLDFPYEFGARSAAFLAFIAAALGAVLFSVYSLFRSFWNYEYQKLPSPTKLREHYAGLTAWHAAHTPTLDTKVAADASFQEYLDERFAEAVEWNGQNNLVRGNYLHRATAAVAFAVAGFLPAAVLYAHAKATAAEKVHQIRLVTLAAVAKEAHMSTTPSPPSAPASSPAAAPSAPAPAPVSIAKPSGPPNELFKSNTELVKPSAGSSSPRK